MRTVAQFREAYSRTGHIGAEPDASYRFPVISHGPMNSAYNRVADFAQAMKEDLELLDRNHAVCLLTSLLLRFLHSVDLSSGGCAQAHPLGVVPEIRADCSRSARIFKFPDLSISPAFLNRGARVQQRHLCFC